MLRLTEACSTFWPHPACLLGLCAQVLLMTIQNPPPTLESDNSKKHFSKVGAGRGGEGRGGEGRGGVGWGGRAQCLAHCGRMKVQGKAGVPKGG